MQIQILDLCFVLLLSKPSRIRTGDCRWSSDQGPAGDWKKWLPETGFGPDRILRSISGSTSGPVCQFVSSPTIFLHSLDPRIKLVWVLALIFLPARSHIYMHFGIVFGLVPFSICVLPTNLRKDQLGRVSLLSGILSVMLALSADGAPP